MKRCIIWGAGKVGSDVDTINLISANYEVTAYYDNNKDRWGENLNSKQIISFTELKNLCVNQKIDVIVICIDDKIICDEVIKQIKSELYAEKMEVFLYRDIEHELEYKYLDVCHSKIKFSWDVEFRNQAQIWIDNLMSEVEYWIIENAEETGYYHDDHLTRLQNKQFALLDRNVEYIEKRLTGNETIMDIGSGLLSKYGNYLGEKKIDFIAVDPLAYFYNIINERYHGEKLPKEKKVLFGMFEFIADFYDVDYVDYIIINNALDHCIDPFKSIIECLHVLKSGGVLHLNHTRCEAVFERYLGLHKWNLDYMNNEFIIWNKDNAINVTKELKNIADVEIIISPNETGKRFYDQFITKIVKKRDFELSKFIDEDSERKDLAYVANLLMKQYASSKLCADDDLCKKLNW